VFGYAAWRRIADRWSKKKAESGLSPRAIFWATATAIGCGLIVLGSIGWAITDNSSYFWAYPAGLVVACVAGVRMGYAIGLYDDDIAERAATTDLLTGTTDVATRSCNGTLCSRIFRCDAKNCIRTDCDCSCHWLMRGQDKSGEYWERCEINMTNPLRQWAHLKKIYAESAAGAHVARLNHQGEKHFTY
jgi:hypothetical protein